MAGKESGHGSESGGETAARRARDVLFVVGMIGIISMLAAPTLAIAAGGFGGATVFELGRRSIHTKNNPDHH